MITFFMFGEGGIEYYNCKNSCSLKYYSALYETHLAGPFEDNKSADYEIMFIHKLVNM